MPAVLACIIYHIIFPMLDTEYATCQFCIYDQRRLGYRWKMGFVKQASVFLCLCSWWWQFNLSKCCLLCFGEKWFVFGFLCPGFCGLYKDRSPALTFSCLRLSTARPQEVEMGSFKQAVYESWYRKSEHSFEVQQRRWSQDMSTSAMNSMNPPNAESTLI